MADPADLRRNAPATLRNREPILGVLRAVLPTKGVVLEVASGTGEHIVFFAAALPTLTWQPSDPSPQARASIAAWIAPAGLDNVQAPLDLDAGTAGWPMDRADAMLCINMTHISPWSVTEGLMRGASHILGAGAPLCLYGPFRRADRPIEPSNQAFDEDLRRRDPRWGLRIFETVASCAASHNLGLESVNDMPANNLTAVFRKL